MLRRSIKGVSLQLEKANEVLRLAETGVSREQIAKELGIDIASVSRALASGRAWSLPREQSS